VTQYPKPLDATANTTLGKRADALLHDLRAPPYRLGAFTKQNYKAAVFRSTVYQVDLSEAPPIAPGPPPPPYDPANFNGKPGTCGRTGWLPKSACGTVTKGALKAREHNITSVGGCKAFCEGCAGCNYISFSIGVHGREHDHDDCSWYSECNMETLAPTSAQYTSAQVKNCTNNGTAPVGSSLPVPYLVEIEKTRGVGAVIRNSNFSYSTGFFGRFKSSSARIEGNRFAYNGNEELELSMLPAYYEGPIELRDVTVTGNTFQLASNQSIDGIVRFTIQPSSENISTAGNRITVV
jgi:hypothetical protein